MKWVAKRKEREKARILKPVANNTSGVQLNPRVFGAMIGIPLAFMCWQ